MKFLPLLILMFAVNAHAWHLGPIGVYSNATQTSSTLTGAGTNLNSSAGNGGSGYGGGVDAQWDLGPLFSLETRAVYVSQTFNNNISGTLSGVTINTGSTSVATAPFIQIPVLLNLKLGSMLALHAGAYYGIATGNISTVNTINGTQQPTSTSTNNINDYGAVGGLEALFGSDKLKILVSADYEYGLANLNSGTTGASSTYNRIIQATAGVLFPF